VGAVGPAVEQADRATERCERLAADANGKPRLTLTVDATGSPRIEFLDENGKIVDRMPQGSK
jgi:hypothetical protein